MRIYCFALRELHSTITPTDATPYLVSTSIASEWVIINRSSQRTGTPCRLALLTILSVVMAGPDPSFTLSVLLGEALAIYHRETNTSHKVSKIKSSSMLQDLHLQLSLKLLQRFRVSSEGVDS